MNFRYVDLGSAVPYADLVKILEDGVERQVIHRLKVASVGEERTISTSLRPLDIEELVSKVELYVMKYVYVPPFRPIPIVPHMRISMNVDRDGDVHNFNIVTGCCSVLIGRKNRLEYFFASDREVNVFLSGVDAEYRDYIANRNLEGIKERLSTLA